MVNKTKKNKNKQNLKIEQCQGYICRRHQQHESHNSNDKYEQYLVPMMNTNNNVEKSFVEGWKLEQHEAHHSNDKHKQHWALRINKNNTRTTSSSR